MRVGQLGGKMLLTVTCEHGVPGVRGKTQLCDQMTGTASDGRMHACKDVYALGCNCCDDTL